MRIGWSAIVALAIGMLALPHVALANHRLAPDIEMIALMTSEDHTFLSSSTVREISVLGGNVSSMVPPHVNIALKNGLAKMTESMQTDHVNSLKD